MAVEARHVSASLRLVDAMENTIHSYHRIRPDMMAAHVGDFLDAVTMLRGNVGGNAFMTVTTELVDTSAQ